MYYIAETVFLCNVYLEYFKALFTYETYVSQWNSNPAAHHLTGGCPILWSSGCLADANSASLLLTCRLVLGATAIGHCYNQ